MSSSASTATDLVLTDPDLLTEDSVRAALCAVSADISSTRASLDVLEARHRAALDVLEARRRVLLVARSRILVARPFVGVELDRINADIAVADKSLQVRVWDHMTACRIPFASRPLVMFYNVNSVCYVFNKHGIPCPSWLRALYAHMVPDSIVTYTSRDDWWYCLGCDWGCVACNPSTELLSI